MNAALRRPPASRVLAASLAACGALALGPGVLATTLRGGAALALEALPILLVAEGLAARAATRERTGVAARLRHLVLAGGCCRPGGGPARAWSPASVVLTAFAVGWPLAAVRALAAAAIDAVSARTASARHPACAGAPHAADGRSGAGHAAKSADLAAALLRVWTGGCLATLGGLALASAPAWTHAPMPALVIGAAIGLAAPCGVGAIALAAGLAAVAPGVAAGLLATSGVARLDAASRAAPAPSGTDGARDPAFTFACAAACAYAALAHGAGLVSPRLVPLLAAGAVAASYLAVRTGRRRAAPPFARLRPRPVARLRATPLALGAVALALLLPASPPDAGETATFADGTPGQRFAFTGRLSVSGREVALERWQIWCCVADATETRVRLAHAPPFAPGTWVRASGRFVATPNGLALALERAEPVAPPADPYVYA